MKARIIEIQREEIAPGIFRRVMWCNVPVDELSFDDTQEFNNRTDQLWPQREAISSLLLRRIQQDKKKRPHHFFESISIPPQHEKVDATDPSKN
ncbi:MAG: hypothetical protein IPP15_19360 [Saprospiraceae bacterium]|uniref:Uncharacterized protein n=1 Tax=Candidatus Opimibacter skivensis TaxID=2982028 RepID=A0A9D7SWF6_9BACT|nr:hypothetical protein [Candidatus Opimibacter skivensis]